jgi:hypothetical protein
MLQPKQLTGQYCPVVLPAGDGVGAGVFCPGRVMWGGVASVVGGCVVAGVIVVPGFTVVVMSSVVGGAVVAGATVVDGPTVVVAPLPPPMMIVENPVGAGVGAGALVGAGVGAGASATGVYMDGSL